MRVPPISVHCFQEQIAERELLAGNIINKGKKDGKNFETESKTSQSLQSENESFEDDSAQQQQHQHQKPKYETQDSFEQGKRVFDYIVDGNLKLNLKYFLFPC